jgi:Zn-dependent M28 family amino/carboxypeptidase
MFARAGVPPYHGAMPTTNPRRVLLAAVAIGLALGAATPRLEERVLVKVERRQPKAVAAGLLDEASGLQELQSGWIASVPATLLSRLQAAGVTLTVLDPAPGGANYFLVFSARAADDAALRTVGRVIPIEPDVTLVATPDGNPRHKVPARLALAPLSLSPPSLVRPQFETAGRPRAVPRAISEAALAAPDPRVAQAVGAVSRDRLADTIRTLESYGSRYATTSGAAAAGNYLLDRFRQSGLPVEYDDFTFTTANYPASNIVATLPGRTSPEEVVVICAHYDSFSDQRPTVAPGADDNASGTAAVLEAARVLAAVPLDFTVKFIAFSAEEFGLYGSRHYAQEARARGERIVAVVNLDMIGFADALPEDLDVTGNSASEWLVNRLASAAATYTSLPIARKINASMRSSDHAPFWDQGYSAVLCIEDDPLRNPYYHRVTDRLETLTMTFAESATRTAVALVADLAQPLGAVSSPSGLSVRTEVLRSLFFRAKRSVLQWTAAAGASGYNVYRATVAHGPYRRMNGSPVASASFTDDFAPAGIAAYYVVTAVDAQGRESNYSAEVSAR